MQNSYAQCYISGRFDGFDGEVDATKLTATALALPNASVRDACMTAAKAAIAKEMDVKTKAQWLKDNADEIKAMGGDTTKALDMYVQGRVDALAHQLEDDVLDVIEDDVEDGEIEKTDEEDEEEEEEEEEEADDADGDDEDEGGES